MSAGDYKTQLTAGLELLARARLRFEGVAEDIESKPSDRVINELRDLLTQIHAELRRREERMQAMVTAVACDAPIPLLVFDGIFGALRTYRRWCAEGMEHCYVEGKLAARPSVFFAELEKRRRSQPLRGDARFRRQGEDPAGGGNDVPPTPTSAPSPAGDARVRRDRVQR